MTSMSQMTLRSYEAVKVILITSCAHLWSLVIMLHCMSVKVISVRRNVLCVYDGDGNNRAGDGCHCHQHLRQERVAGARS